MLKELLSVNTIKNNAKDFDGWLTDNESELLFSTASCLSGRGCIVEIGSWCAKSLSFIVAGAIQGNFTNKIYSIDPFLTSKDEPNGKYETFVQNLKMNGILEYVTHIKEKSQIVGTSFTDPIELIFIDGFHKYDAVKRDFELFYPKIVDDGYMALHDIWGYLGPTKLLMKILQDSSGIKIVSVADSIVLLQKKLILSDSDKVKNKNMLYHLEKFFITNKDKMVN